MRRPASANGGSDYSIRLFEQTAAGYVAVKRIVVVSQIAGVARLKEDITVYLAS